MELKKEQRSRIVQKWERGREDNKKRKKHPVIIGLCKKSPKLKAEMERLSLPLDIVEKMPIAPRKRPPKHKHSMPGPTRRIFVKMLNGTNATIKNKKLVGAPSGLSKQGTWELMFKGENLAEHKHLAELRTGREHADLSQWFILVPPDGNDLVNVINDILEYEVVETAEFELLSVPTDVSPPPYPPNFYNDLGAAANQLAHLADVRTGLNVISTWPTTMGAGIKACIVEVGGHGEHIGISGITDVNNSGIWDADAHAALTMGILFGDDNRNDANNGGNTWGTIGIAPDVDKYFHQGTSGFIPALIDAGFGPGDVISISISFSHDQAVGCCEDFVWGKTYNVPGQLVKYSGDRWSCMRTPNLDVEPGTNSTYWDKPSDDEIDKFFYGDIVSFPIDELKTVYDALEIASSLGIIVVIAAGNSGVYLGSDHYNGPSAFFPHEPWGAGRLDIIHACLGEVEDTTIPHGWSGLSLKTLDRSPRSSWAPGEAGGEATGFLQACIYPPTTGYTTYLQSIGVNPPSWWPGETEFGWWPDEGDWPDEYENPSWGYSYKFTGTSCSTPQIAGAACLIQSYYKSALGIVLTPAQLIEHLHNNGKAPDSTGTWPWDVRVPDVGACIAVTPNIPLPVPTGSPARITNTGGLIIKGELDEAGSIPLRFYRAGDIETPELIEGNVFRIDNNTLTVFDFEEYETIAIHVATYSKYRILIDSNHGHPSLISALDIRLYDENDVSIQLGQSYAASSSQLYHDASYAFNENASDWWSSTSISNQWLTVEFSVAVHVAKISMYIDTISDNIKDFTLQAEKNGSWIDILIGGPTLANNTTQYWTVG